MEKLKVGEIVVVEGKYDKNALSQVIDGVIIATGGFGIFKNPALRRLLKRLCEERGVVVLTDPDGAGSVIRGHLRGLLPSEKVKHAYLPQIPGRERRKRSAGAEGLLGAEGMPPEVLRDALLKAGVNGKGAGRKPITKADLYEWGLSGGDGSSARRAALCKSIGIPVLPSKALCEALTALYGREEVLGLLAKAPD